MSTRPILPITAFVTIAVASALGFACKPSSSTPPADQPTAAAATDTDDAAGETHDQSAEGKLDARPLLALVPEPRDEAATKAFMKGISDALGQDCNFCHEDSGRGRHHSKIAVWMAENFSNFVSKSTGAPVTCNDCHQGHDHLFPRDENDRPDLAGVLVADVANDKDALKARMKAMSDALGVDCDYCHDTADFKKPTRNQKIASFMQAELVAKYTLADGSALSCEGCHQGKTKLID